jgi:hypothetical protein
MHYRSWPLSSRTAGVEGSCGAASRENRRALPCLRQLQRRTGRSASHLVVAETTSMM